MAAAGDRLHLSSPAMSRALGRIRRVTGDQILVRTGRTMTPTPYALSIRVQVHDLVQQAESVLAPDAITTALGPKLIAAVHREAPNVRRGSSWCSPGRISISAGVPARRRAWK
ncbi:LysR family transcriptional regulator [Amycolatopsis sp. lyj-109]|uniref:LysR family transcriptional regulator n=1 Tax=Amycolatopsis sp. lyj-109 TaxID=2789287 RepID=UPI00397E3518